MVAIGSRGKIASGILLQARCRPGARAIAPTWWGKDVSGSESALEAADLRQVDERPRARHLADRDLDQRRLVVGEAALQRGSQAFRIGHAVAGELMTYRDSHYRPMPAHMAFVPR